MAYINTVESDGVQVGSSLAPPIASIEAWPSLDPQSIASFNNMGVHLGNGAQIQTGIYNGIGLQNILGLTSLLGFKTGVGGQTNAEPKNDSSAPIFNQSSPDGNLWGGWKYNGSIICVAPCSDINAKKNISPLENSLDKVLKLNGVSFDWNEKVVPILASTQQRQIGLIAQQVEEVVPEVVEITTVENNELKSVNYEVLTSLLIEAVKEQQAQIDQLKETVQKLSTPCPKCSGSCYTG